MVGSPAALATAIALPWCSAVEVPLTAPVTAASSPSSGASTALGFDGCEVVAKPLAELAVAFAFFFLGAIGVPARDTRNAAQDGCTWLGQRDATTLYEYTAYLTDACRP